MASTKSSALSLSVHEIDTNVLFEKFTVEEIRQIEKKTRADIERKKEDLRVMVGERYRDLIDAADTIKEMKNSAENVMNSISNMEELCQGLKKSHNAKMLRSQKPTSTTRQMSQESRYYGVASQIKLLLDMPEKMWSAVDQGAYLTATQLYLLSRHINTGLHLDSQHAAVMLPWFPVLTRQWAAISHFKSTILQGCKRLIKRSDVADKLIAESLCSIMLLEDSTPRQVFTEFLLARTVAVQELFLPCQNNLGIKELVSQIVRLIVTTLHQIHAVFYTIVDRKQDDEGNVSSNLLLSTFDSVSSKGHGSNLLNLHESISAKYLPQSVTEFHPTLHAHASPISARNLQDNCSQWINTCIQDVKTGVSKLLDFINTVKRLADIRDSVWETLAEDDKLSDWDTVCHRVLNKALSVWEIFLRPIFVDRIKALVEFHLDMTAEVTKRHLAKVVMELANSVDSGMTSDVDLSEYIWSEASGDIPPQTAWVASGKKLLSDGGGLLMKAKVFTPVIQNLCKLLDEKLQSLQVDTDHYVVVPAEQSNQSSGPFDRYSDADYISNKIQKSCELCIQQILDYIADQLKLWKISLNEIHDPMINQITQDKILLAGRFCAAMCELTPHLQKCIHRSSPHEKEGLTRITRHSSLGRVKTSFEDPVWTTIKTKLLNTNTESYRIWSQYTSSCITEVFRKALESHNGQILIGNCTRWDEIEIQEETEDGKNVKSIIRVPMQASWYLQDVLYKVCCEMNRVGGHALSRSLSKDFIQRLFEGIITSYERFLKGAKGNTSKEGYIALTQQRALQYLFDVKFVAQIILYKDDSEVAKSFQKRVQKIVDSLEEVVDPFDLDVFYPYISDHVMKGNQRCSVLFGALISEDRSLLSSRPAPASQQKQHNILPLTSSQSRFPLLPVGSWHTARHSIPQPVLAQPASKRSSESPTSTSDQKEASSSFYNKLGSMWFSSGNKS